MNFRILHSIDRYLIYNKQILMNNYSIKECTYGRRVGPWVGSPFRRVGSGPRKVTRRQLCGCPPHAIGKQYSMPLINLGHKHAIQIQA